MFTDKRIGSLGKKGEDLVARYLRYKGLIIIKRNYSNRYAEIDIIAEDRENIVFVEVKTRTAGYLVSGAEAVDTAKQTRLRNAAEMFVSMLNTDKSPRMDLAEVVATVNKDGKISYDLKYTKSAF